jgi:hypothetical protein
MGNNMTTGEALKLVQEFGYNHNLPGFLETIEALDYMIKSPEYLRNYLVSENLIMAYNITIGEMQSFCGYSE